MTLFYAMGFDHFQIYLTVQANLSGTDFMVSQK